ncbi:hypothetical protein GGU11DRAFT_802949 [Lentinula aff. detonsa]|nr:hypothetical protein GGU11DRAFT_802949 [Lentinula aff. detonsa]
MNLLQRIVRLLRKLYNSTPLAVRLTIRSVPALYTFLARCGRKWSVEKERTNARPDLTGKTHSFGLPSPSGSPPEGMISVASRIPANETLYPYSFSGCNASVLSQDISASSIHTDVSAQQSSQQLQYISHTRTRPSDHRSRSNPQIEIDISSISGQHLGLSGSASCVSSRPNSLYGQTRPPSFHGQLSVSRPISPYTSRHGSGSQVSISPSITIDRGPDEEGFETAPSQTFSIQEDSPFTHLENLDEPGFKQLSELHERFRPIPLELYPRYERSTHVPDECTTYTVKALTTSFGLEEQIPAEWKTKVHPEGALYYVYRDGRFYTGANIMDDLTRDRIVACINDFDGFIRSRSIQLSSRTNTVFNLYTDPHDPDEYTCGYYIADHATRSIFWLDDVDAESFPVWGEVKGVTSPTHIEHAIVSLYWYHCHLFPHSYVLTIEAVDELRDILLHCICDTITSSTSTVPYSVASLKEMMNILNNLRKNPATGEGVSAYSRIAYIFARLRFLHFHGQPAARLDRDQSVHRKTNRHQNHHPWWMKCLSPALFSAPDLYHRTLSEI